MNADRLFEKYGQSTILLIEGDERQQFQYKAFVQPLRYKNKLYLRGKYTPVGKNQEDYYLYIGPAQYDISRTDGISVHLHIGNTEYLVYRTEKRNFSDRDIYIWAIIRPITEDNETPENNSGEAIG